MILSSGLQRIKAIVLAVCYLRATQCMYNSIEKASLLKGPSAIEEAVTSHVKSEDDIEEYFNSIRQFRQPSPGLAKEHLDLVISKSKSGEPGSPHDQVLVDPYWAYVHVDSLVDDSNQRTRDLDEFMDELSERKSSSEIVNYDGNKRDNQKLVHHARSLKYIDTYVKGNMPIWVNDWARENGLPLYGLFQTRDDSLIKGSSGKSLKESERHAGTQTLLDRHLAQALEEVFQDLYSYRWIANPNENVLKLRRISIQTVDQLYKHGLITEETFKSYIEKWCNHNGHASRNIWQHLSKFGKEYKNNLFGADRRLFTSWSLSPFVNMLEVLPPRPKRRLLFTFLELDARKYKRQGDSLLKGNVERWINAFFNNDALLGYLQGERYHSKNDVAKELQWLIEGFKGSDLWSGDWKSSEELRILGQILHFVDKNFLRDAEKSHLLELSTLLDDEVRERINLMSSRSKALSELENITEYLIESTHPSQDQRGTKIMPTLQELNILENNIENLPSQIVYRKNIENLGEREKSSCQEEIQVQMTYFKQQLDAIRAKHSEGTGFFSRVWAPYRILKSIWNAS
ncbi:hypothetical protein MJO28_002970 [Puccinia striiformis f. sp. tritici]|uniref:Uncharacterized protein n=4 Tax=Puccinia striiformis TaxID=27350 RepID=A0A0L0VAH0_9BASI|nr:hypothetical protein Pst134EA_005093 [Puccinia striiformis f. sp. tritici]KAI9619989.1 hypothetical protein H4Q26_013971 [Puccinia striiformis f. sp. tritici PST-130]KNE96287.1 hypothetical protein PSTG_10406 [Puccinia striiformis f. sp. tritici PST-78]POW09852.1 hypothetical protein PSTT_06508 [Puccinia striiformis]KAH9462245.1 hypothetical protein Pst134EB_006152 [Puccinia striiformis f. sp. tritici]KAH9471185.1 hypothetical protein Pst134EA_005093 [Puccinia striiformis f. sp. tritici]